MRRLISLLKQYAPEERKFVKDVLRSSKGTPERFKIRRSVAIPSVDRHPFYDKLTASQIGEIGEYKDIAGLRLDKLQEKTAGSRIDIPEIYGDVKARYAELGYPVAGDRLVVSEQPTYTNGKSVPESVMKPNESGGNTQDDGTVRINPKYRSVMRYWKLKGSGRDFLRAIIGHELGHHIDRTVLSKEPGQSRRNSLLQAIRSSKFHTVYTDSYGLGTDPRKLDKELLAEYLSSVVNANEEKMAEGYTVRKVKGSSLDDAQIKRLSQLFRQLDKAEQTYEDPYGLEISQPSDSNLKKWIRKRDGILMAQDKGGGILGFADVHRAGDYKRTGAVSTLVVDEDSRGKGIGRSLLRRALSDNRRRRWKTVLHVHMNNKAGMGLYASEGFVPTAQLMVALEKKADAARAAMVRQNRAAAGLAPAVPQPKPKYLGGHYGGAAYENPNGTVTVRKGNNALTVSRKAYDETNKAMAGRNTQMLVPGAMVSGVVDSAADIMKVPQSFEPIVNAFSPSAAKGYSDFFSRQEGRLRTAAGAIRAATDGNPNTHWRDSSTYGAKDPLAGDGMQMQDLSKAISYAPRAYFTGKYAVKPLLRSGKWLSTGTSAPATVARMAGGAGFARHGYDMVEEGHPVMGATCMALGALGMGGPVASQGAGYVARAQSAVNRFADPVLSRASRFLGRMPFAGRHASKAVETYIPAGLAVSPDPHVAIPR